MPTFDASWSGALRIVGDLERPDHWHLQVGDECAFFGEYTPRAGYKHSVTNQLVLNMKKKPSVARGTYQWPHKVRAIATAAAAIRAGVNPGALATSLFVPIPSSKTPAHPDYDPRMFQVAQAIGAPARAAEVLRTRVDRDALHENADRRDPVALAETFELRADLIPDDIARVFLIDDMLTTGCSFRACKDTLTPYLPGKPIIGLFVSRRVLPDPFGDFTAIDL